MGETQMSLGSGKVYLMSPDGEYQEALEIASIPEFIPSEEAEEASTTFGSFRDNCTISAQFEIPPYSRRKFMPLLMGWRAKGPIRRRQLMKAIRCCL